MKKRAIIIFVIMVLLFLSAFLFIYNKQENKIALKIIAKQENLSPDMIKWIENKQKNRGIYLYQGNSSESFKVLVLFAKNYNRNLYVTTKASAKIVEHKLIINFTDEPATGDIYVTDKVIVELALKSKPKEIEVYYNNRKEDFSIERALF